MQWFDEQRDYVNEFVDRWNEEIKRAKIAMIVVGVLLAVAGVACLASPADLYAVIQIIAGVLIIARGIGEIVAYAKTPEFFRDGVMLATGILECLVGVLLLMLPSYVTAGTLVFLLATLLVMSGIERLSINRHMRFFRIVPPAGGTAIGVINIVFGLLFLMAPAFASVVLSYTVGIYLIVAGVMLVIEGATMKKIER